MFKTLKAAAKSKVTEAATELDLKQILKGYSLEGDGVRGSTASGGHHLWWKCFNALRDKTGEKVTVHLADKRELEEHIGKEAASKIVDRMKLGNAQQMKVLHPSVLKILEALREKGPYLMFATERVLCSCENALGGTHNVEVATQSTKQLLKNMTLLEKKYGLFQVAEGLAFLHTQVGVLHLNLTPAYIFVTPSYEFKISGFEFSVHKDGSRELCKNFQDFKEENGAMSMFNALINPYKGPDLEYASPEYVGKMSLSQKTDLFSFGCTMHELLHSTPMQRAKLLTVGADVALYNSKVSSLPTDPTLGVATVRDLFTKPDSIFTELPIKCLVYLARFMEKDDNAKKGFCKDLYSVVDTYSAAVVKAKVLPVLLGELYGSLQVFVLPIVLRTVAVLSQNDFSELLFQPHFTRMMGKTAANVNLQTSALLLEKMDDITAKTTPDELRDHIVPFLATQLEANVSKGLLSVVAGLGKKGAIPEPMVVKDILPRVLWIVRKYTDTSVKTYAVGVLSELCKGLMEEKAIIVEKILPGMKTILQNEKDRDVLEAIGSFYTSTAALMDMATVAGIVIPSLSQVLAGCSSDPKLFACILSTIRSLLDAVEAQQRRPPPVPVQQQQLPVRPPSPPSTSWRGDLPAGTQQGADSQQDEFQRLSSSGMSAPDDWAAFAQGTSAQTVPFQQPAPVVQPPVSQQTAATNKTAATLDDLFGF
eukprot:TRINITY_DN13692_c0_g1_i1.p1 TRINITY_DN13692_c0_g1~~TRINITY_DN13692_c0_g1_i1.p1  ORF type:complete len:725 (+),score=201.55 TRINITY_DN13692_c0_g1_i1:60-2177(+)